MDQQVVLNPQSGPHGFEVHFFVLVQAISAEPAPLVSGLMEDVLHGRIRMLRQVASGMITASK